MRNRKNILKYALMVLTAILITATGIYYHQHPLKVLPLYISLVVGFLQTSANRYSLLIGGFNSILYTIAYIIMGLYGSAAQAFFFSCLFQLASFVLWNRRKSGRSTRFRKLPGLARAIIAAGFIVAFAVVALLLRRSGSASPVLDSLSSLLGALTTVLTLFAFIEYSWLMMPSVIITGLLYLSTMRTNPGDVTFLIFNIYSLICVTHGFFSVRRLYKEQQKEETANEG